MGLQTAQDNIDLQTTILSRFDLIFIVKDIRKYSQDKVSKAEINYGDHCNWEVRFVACLGRHD